MLVIYKAGRFPARPFPFSIGDLSCNFGVRRVFSAVGINYPFNYAKLYLPHMRCFQYRVARDLHDSNSRAGQQ